MVPVQFDVTLFIIAVLAAIVTVTVVLLHQVLLLTGRNRVVSLETRNAQLRKRQEALQEHYRALQERTRAAEVDEKSVQAQILEIRRRTQRALVENYVVLHEFGEPGGRRRLWIGGMALGGTLTVNQTTGKDSILRGARHHLEIWAESEQDAVRIARQAFPAESGFTLTKLSPAPQSEATAAARPVVTLAAQ